MNYTNAAAAEAQAAATLLAWASKAPAAAGLNRAEIIGLLTGSPERIATRLGGDARMQRIVRRAARRVEAAARATKQAFCAAC